MVVRTDIGQFLSSTLRMNTCDAKMPKRHRKQWTQVVQQKRAQSRGEDDAPDQCQHHLQHQGKGHESFRLASCLLRTPRKLLYIKYIVINGSEHSRSKQ